MSHSTIGPKEAQQRELARIKRENLNNIKKPSKADLRNAIAKVKPMTNKGGKRGR